jgi:hypothetical protein
MLFEALESREYFAFTCTLKNGVLTIGGTAAADVITVNNISSKTIGVGGSSSDGKNVLSKTFNTSSVKQVKILAGAGGDYVTCHSLAKAIKLTIDGGSGDDILQGSISGVNTIIGGAGKDIMSAGTGGATFQAKGDKAVDDITAYKGDTIVADKTDHKHVVG